MQKPGLTWDLVILFILFVYTHRIHVWNTYLHWDYFKLHKWGQCRSIFQHHGSSVYIIHLFGAHLVIFQHVMSVSWDHPMPPRIRAAVLSSFAWWCPLEELPATVEREQKTDLFKLKRALLVGGLEHFLLFHIYPYIGNVIIPTDELHHFSDG